MTPLERLGLEVAAFQLLGSRTKAATLCALIHASGRTVSYDAVTEARAYMGESVSLDTQNVASVRVCLLREGLRDVGLDDPITTVRHYGYALPEPGRTAVIERLVEVAGQ